VERLPVTTGLFELNEAGDGHLLGGLCVRCSHWHFPATPDCPYCAAEDCQTRALSRRGTLCLFTTVTHRPPGYQGELPFGFGVVELPEGLQLITRLSETDPQRLSFGMPMRLEFVTLHVDEDGREVVTYAFAPDGGTS
jgi:uncharacterized OB-fold protein